MTSTDSAPSPVRPAADHVVHRVLRLGRAVFSTGPGWRTPELHVLMTRVRRAAAHGDGPWEERWASAVRGQGDAVIQLAAESLYAHVLFPDDLRAATKRSLVMGTVAWMEDPVQVPPRLDAALEVGIAGTGIAFTRRRLSQLAFLLSAAAAWRGMAAPQRRAALEDPWTFKDWLWQIPPDGGQPQREILLHLVHPQAFEPIVSRAVKRRIVEGFGAAPPDGDVDRGLHRLREQLSPEHGPGFSFMDPAVAAAWRSIG